MTVLTLALALGQQPAADKDREGDDGNDEYCRGPSGKASPLHIDEGKPPTFCLVVFDSDLRCISLAICFLWSLSSHLYSLSLAPSSLGGHMKYLLSFLSTLSNVQTFLEQLPLLN